MQSCVTERASIYRELLVFHQRDVEQAGIATAEDFQANAQRQGKILVALQTGAIEIAIPDRLAYFWIAMDDLLCLTKRGDFGPFPRTVDQTRWLDHAIMFLGQGLHFVASDIARNHQDRILWRIVFFVEINSVLRG